MQSDACSVLKSVSSGRNSVQYSLALVCRANLQRFIADVWPRSSYPPPRGVPGQALPKEAARSSRAGSRPPQVQPQALSNGNDRMSRYGQWCRNCLRWELQDHVHCWNRPAPRCLTVVVCTHVLVHSFLAIVAAALWVEGLFGLKFTSTVPDRCCAALLTEYQGIASDVIRTSQAAK